MVEYNDTMYKIGFAGLTVGSIAGGVNLSADRPIEALIGFTIAGASIYLRHRCRIKAYKEGRNIGLFSIEDKMDE